MDILNQPYNNLLLLAFAAAMLWLLWPSKHRKRGPARRRNNRQRKALEKLRMGSAYWGVTLRGKQCDALRPYLGKKFPLDRAPALPLPGCKARRCQCRYQGLVERRRAQRRSGTDQRRTVRLDANHPDRRSGKDRRRGALAWKGAPSHVGTLSPGFE
jgi:hypothetical protein